MQAEKDPEVFLPKEQKKYTPDEFAKTDRQDSVIFDLDKPNPTSRLPKLFSNTAHPIIALLHILMKAGVVFLYLALPLVTSQTNETAFLIVAGAIDFYFTKNVSGRKLVGMRWEIEVSDQGREMLRFESKMDERAIPQGNQTVFWYPFYIFFIVWIVLLVISVMIMFWDHVFMCLYQFIILRYNYNYFSQCYKTRGLHVERLVNQHGPDTLLQFQRGTITSRIDSDPRANK